MEFQSSSYAIVPAQVAISFNEIVLPQSSTPLQTPESGSAVRSTVIAASTWPNCGESLPPH